MELSKRQLTFGVTMAVLATLLWAGNFIVARGVTEKIPPVSLAFYRWATASLLIFPLAMGKLKQDIPVIRKNMKFLLITAFTGVALFNTLIYFAGAYTSAINMALIGTTSSPVFVILIAAFFFKEKIQPIRIAGIVLCISGIAVLLSNGSLESLLSFRFGIGDLLILLSALSFAVYNILVKRKPRELSSTGFLNIIFLVGTLILLPFFAAETATVPPVQWDAELLLIILYLGLGTSVTAFLLWNAAIEKIGAVRTALFGNLIPIFASIEAIWLLGESLGTIHFISAALVIAGLFLANSRKANQPASIAVKNDR